MFTKKISLFLLFMLCLAFSAFAGSIAEYTADMVNVKTGRVTQKIAVMPNKMYFESLNDQGKRDGIVIVRLDQKKLYVVMEDTKSYMERPFDKDRFTAADLSMGQIDVQTKQEKVGSEKVSGYKADKFRNTVTMQIMGMNKTYQSYQWMAPEFDPMPIRTENEGVVLEMRNIKTGRPNASLFEPPNGYKRDTQMEQMMEQMKGGKGGK